MTPFASAADELKAWVKRNPDAMAVPMIAAGIEDAISDLECCHQNEMDNITCFGIEEDRSHEYREENVFMRNAQ